jgi:V/A-type H+/Na+-transporting ATPase subunit E
VALEQLLEALERDAGAEVERVLADGREKAERIAAAAAAERERRRRAATQNREHDRRELTERGLSDARRVARRAVLEAQQVLLDRVFQAVRARLPAAVGSAGFEKTVPARVSAALVALGNEPAVIHCPEALVATLRRLAGARATIVADPACGSGFTVDTADGVLRVDETLETQLERQRPALARSALDVLAVAS